MWILWKMSLWKCEFCQKWDFENVNFVKKWDFENVNFWINWGFLPQCQFWTFPIFRSGLSKIHRKKNFGPFSNFLHISLLPLEILHVKNLYGLLSALLPAAAFSIEKWISLATARKAEVGKMVLSIFYGQNQWDVHLGFHGKLSLGLPLKSWIFDRCTCYCSFPKKNCQRSCGRSIYGSA